MLNSRRYRQELAVISIQLFIDGHWQCPTAQGTHQILSPIDEAAIAAAADATREETRRAIAAARSAFDEGPWRRTTHRERAKLLNRIADLIDKDATNLARLESLNTGKTLAESTTDMGDIAAAFRYFAALVAVESGAVNEAQPHSARGRWRVRTHHTMELPAAAGGVEDRARAGRG